MVRERRVNQPHFLDSVTQTWLRAVSLQSHGIKGAHPARYNSIEWDPQAFVNILDEASLESLTEKINNKSESR